jgi:hypothetical protein
MALYSARASRMLFSTQSKAVKSNKPGIATNTAAAKAFPDRGGDGYLGRALHTEVARVSPLGRRSPRTSGCQYLIDLGPPMSAGARYVVLESLDPRSIFMQGQRSIEPTVA